MIGYGDKTWCLPKTCTGKCGRQFTEADHRASVAWWGSEDYPLSVADFCDEYRKEETG